MLCAGQAVAAAVHAAGSVQHPTNSHGVVIAARWLMRVAPSPIRSMPNLVLPTRTAPGESRLKLPERHDVSQAGKQGGSAGAGLFMCVTVPGHVTAHA